MGAILYFFRQAYKGILGWCLWMQKVAVTILKSFPPHFLRVVEGLAISQVTHLLFCASQSCFQKRVSTFAQHASLFCEAEQSLKENMNYVYKDCFSYQ